MRSDAPSEHRARVIVVEDNFPIADGLKYLLESAGYDVVGMAGNVEDARRLVATVAFDLALLDIDLRGDSVAPVAEDVLARAKPLIFLSGYGETEMLPDPLHARPRLEKPVDPETLLAAIAQALTATSAR